jgi:two-component system sensor histidine kinase KdpD
MREPCDIEDLIGAATEQLERRLQNRSLAIDVPPEMPLVSMDFVLMERVLVNMLDNAQVLAGRQAC